MAFRIITVPFDNDRGVFPDNELNTFLLDKKVRSYRVEFFIHAGRPYWSVFLEYEEVEDRSVEKLTQALDERQKLVFERLKDWRKSKGEGTGNARVHNLLQRSAGRTGQKAPTDIRGYEVDQRHRGQEGEELRQRSDGHPQIL